MYPNGTCPCSRGYGRGCENADEFTRSLFLFMSIRQRIKGKPIPFRIDETVCAMSFTALLHIKGNEDLFDNNEVIEIFSLLIKCELGGLKRRPEIPIKRLHLRETIPVYRILKKRIATFTSDQCNTVTAALIMASGSPSSPYKRYWRKQCEIFIEEHP